MTHPKWTGLDTVVSVLTLLWWAWVAFNLIVLFTQADDRVTRTGYIIGAVIGGWLGTRALRVLLYGSRAVLRWLLGKAQS